MSEGEGALRALLKQPDPTKQLEGLLTNATPAGQLYGLLGLRIRDHEAYDKAIKDFRVPEIDVETIGGCMVSRAPLKQLVDRIKAGQYDQALSRPAW